MIARFLQKSSLLIVALLVTLGSLLVAAPAYAQDPTALVKRAGVIVRGGPGVGFWKVATLRNQQIVPVVGVSGDRAFWQVKADNGAIGFVPAGDVEAKNADGVPVIGTEPIGTITAGNAAVRGGPGVEAARIATLRRGSQFFIIGRQPDGKWVEIRYNANATGWVATSVTNLTVEAVGESAPATTAGPRVVVNVPFINLRSGPGDEFSIIGKLRGGTEMPILGQNGDGYWLYVESPSGKGWINKLNTITKDFFGGVPVVANTSNEYNAKVITGAAAIRKGPGIAFDRVGNAAARADVTIIGKSPDGAWWLVRFGEIQGWMSKAVLRAPAQAENVPVVTP
jgi:N-acetylmuramoyl-L-alanine amidase